MIKWSLSAEFLSLILIVILMIYFHEEGLASTVHKKMYRLCLWFSAGFILLDSACILTITRATALPLWINLALNSVYFLSGIFMCSALILYLFTLVLEHVYDKRCLKQAFFWVSGLTAGYALVLVWNLWSGVVFSFDHAGNYLRGPFNTLGYGVMAIELGLLGSCYLRNRISSTRSIGVLMHTLLPLALALTALQFFFPDLLLSGTIVAMTDLLLFLSIRSRRFEWDSLTGIGNRNRFFTELGLRIAGGQHFQVILMSFTQLDVVNQRFGHQNGDAILREIAHSLNDLQREGRAFRFGNVSFAVLLPCRDEEEARVYLHRILSHFGQPWRLNGIEALLPIRCTDLVYINASWTPAQTLEYLEYGLRLAKAGPEPVVRFDPSVARQLEHRKSTLDLMRRSIREKRFQVWYQPIYSCKEKSFTAAEALLRLQDDRGEPVSPAEFIPLAEEAGLIGELGWIVLEEVCRLLGSDRAAGLKTVSINLSMQQFTDPNLTRRVSALLSHYGVSPKRLKIEITERVLLDDMMQAHSAMCALSNLGVRFYLDDFGTGYSNLSCLLDLPFECVKLDQCLLATFPESDSSELLIHTLMDLFHDLSLHVVVEGVERGEQAEALSSMGADLLQGYYFTYPMPEENLIAFFEGCKKSRGSTAAV